MTFPTATAVAAVSLSSWVLSQGPVGGWHDPNVVIPAIATGTVFVLSWWFSRKVVEAKKDAGEAKAKTKENAVRISNVEARTEETVTKLNEVCEKNPADVKPLPPRTCPNPGCHEAVEAPKP